MKLKLKRKAEPCLIDLAELGGHVKVFKTRPYAKALDIIKELDIVCETYWEDCERIGFYVAQTKGMNKYILHAFVASFGKTWKWIICLRTHEAEARAIADEMICEYEI